MGRAMGEFNCSASMCKKVEPAKHIPGDGGMRIHANGIAAACFRGREVYENSCKK